MTLFTRAWWEAAGSRAAYTALAAVLPLAMLLVSGDVAPLYVLSVTALALVASLVTSLLGLPEISEATVPLWRAIVVRVLKTAAQVAAPVLAAAALIEQIDGRELLVQIGGAALVTLVRTLMAYLPEASEPIDAVLVVDDGYQGRHVAPPA